MRYYLRFYDDNNIRDVYLSDIDESSYIDRVINFRRFVSCPKTGDRALESAFIIPVSSLISIEQDTQEATILREAI